MLESIPKFRTRLAATSEDSAIKSYPAIELPPHDTLDFHQPAKARREKTLKAQHHLPIKLHKSILFAQIPLISNPSHRLPPTFITAQSRNTIPYIIPILSIRLSKPANSDQATYSPDPSLVPYPYLQSRISKNQMKILFPIPQHFPFLTTHFVSCLQMLRPCRPPPPPPPPPRGRGKPTVVARGNLPPWRQ